MNALRTCLAVGRSEDQTGKWISSHDCVQVKHTFMHPTRLAPNSMRKLSHSLLQAIIHPDTGEKIFMPFRMSGMSPDEDLCGTRLNPSILSSYFNFFGRSFTLTVMFSLCRLRSIWNANCKCRTKTTHLIHAFHGSTDFHERSHIWEQMK